MLIGIPAFAFGATANTLTSRLIGEGKADAVNQTLLQTLRISLVCIMPVLILCLSAPHLALSIYTDDAILAAAAVPSLYVVCLGVIGMSFGMVFFEAISGTGNTLHALYIEIAVQMFYIFVIWLFAVHLHTSVAYVWLSEFTYGAGIGILSCIYLRKAKWQKKI